MYGNKFFKEQSEATRIKTLIYEEYISSYLIQNISKYKKVYIADLFCGLHQTYINFSKTVKIKWQNKNQAAFRQY